MATKKNVNIELMRFLLSLFVLGYHTRLAADYGADPLFKFGYFAVEFFFVLSGFLLAGSLERAYSAPGRNLLADTGGFMWKKIRAILPYHIVAVVLMVAVVGAYDLAGLSERLASGGWTGIFLVQSAVVWTVCEGIVVPEWYLSSMFIIMLIIYPCARLLAKKIRHRELIPVILLGGLAVIAVAVGFGVKWQFSWNLSNDLRAFGEMCLGMLLFYLAKRTKCKTPSRAAHIVLAVAEGACYVLSFVMMCLPFDIIGTIGIPVEIVLATVAITISFSGHGIPSPGGKTGRFFGLLGSISLPLYMLHPVVTELASRAFTDLPAYAVVLICFALSLALTAVCYGANVGMKRLRAKKKAPTDGDPQGGGGDPQKSQPSENMSAAELPRQESL